jgi:hypothetical protein
MFVEQSVHYTLLFYSILFHWHVQNVTIPCRSQELLPFLRHIPYILESNPHSVFGDFVNGKKKLVRGSNPQLSFNHSLPTGRLIE